MIVSNGAESISLREYTSTQARALRPSTVGAPVTGLESAENGFYEVIDNGRRGYALAQYLSYCVAEISLKGG